MQTKIRNQRKRALTLVELLVIIAIIAIFAAMIDFGVPTDAEARALRIQCVNNLKQIGLATRVWEGDNGGKYPWSIPGTNGGTMDSISGPNAWRHFQVMSNELSTPKVVICPLDDSRMTAATNFNFFNNSNVSFFIGLDASETSPESILSGDCNITNGTPIRNGILQLTTNNPVGWTAEMHNKVGNLLLADGSVQQVSQIGLRQALADSNPFTNRLQMPVLAP